MLLPLNLNTGDEFETPIPCVIVERYRKYWFCLLGLFIFVDIMNIVAGDVFGVLFMGIMSFIIWYMVNNSCRNMSQYCLMLFGLMCVIQASFELVTVLMLAQGRSVRNVSVSTALSPNGEQKTQTITTVEEVHPFFDKDMGFKYNVQSAAHVASPIVMVFGAVLAYLCYNSYPNSMLSGMNGPDEAGPINGRPGGFYGGAGGGGTGGGATGGGGGGTRIVNGQVVGGGGGTSRPSGVGIFEGQGQRLGGP